MKLMIVVSLVFLVVTSARASVPDDRIGFGTRLVFTTPLEFGRAREKTFCNGRETGALGKLSLRMCCDLTVTGVARDARVTWAAGPREVTWVNWNHTKIVVDGASGSSIRCIPNAVDEIVLRKAFGAYLAIEEVVRPASSLIRGRITL